MGQGKMRGSASNKQHDAVTAIAGPDRMHCTQLPQTCRAETWPCDQPFVSYKTSSKFEVKHPILKFFARLTRRYMLLCNSRLAAVSSVAVLGPNRVGEELCDFFIGQCVR